MAAGGNVKNLDFVSLGAETVNCAEKKNDIEVGSGAGALVNGKPMICGGYTNEISKKCFEAGNPSNSVDMSVPRIEHAGMNTFVL